MRNGAVSFWFAPSGPPEPLAHRPSLSGRSETDVCIVGAGFTGLWTAYYLAEADPSLGITVLEREFAGFGASGRNGGWLTEEFAGATGDPMRSALRATVDEVLLRISTEEIDAQVARGGWLEVARSAAGLARLRARLTAEPGLDALSADELAGRVRIAGALGAAFNEHAARIQPAKLVRGLARAVERRGVVIHEGSAVTGISPGRVQTPGGVVHARHVIVCTEGFTSGLPDRGRRLLPLNSAMIATAPLPDEVWSEIGWRNAELIGDSAHAFMYAQRTADGRIALGGRGVPYRLGSKTDVGGRTQRRTISLLTRTLHEMFPPASMVPVEHAWCGVLGVARDWQPSVVYDSSTGIGTAGGYVGNGVGPSNLAGRTLTDLILGRQSELTRLPWVGHRSRDWEPEPLRFLGARGVYALYRAADRSEARSRSARTHPLARFAGLLSGRGAH